MSSTLSNFFFDTPLYSIINLDEDSFQTFQKIFSNKRDEVDFEGFNPNKNLDSTFIVKRCSTINLVYITNTSNYFNILIKCKRTENIFYFFVFWDPNRKMIMKVGQYPSVADFHIKEVKQYKKILPQEKLTEFTRAIGLAANGVGIGSFVYLRRIFEHLIFEAKSEAITDKAITETQFKGIRMDEKIQLLQNYLPDFLVEHKTMYSILSLGVHQLDEKSCLDHFNTLRVGIEIILDEKLEEFKKKDKRNKAKKDIDTLSKKMKK